MGNQRSTLPVLNAFKQAIDEYDLTTLKQLIRDNKQAARTCQVKGDSLLIYAARLRHTEVVKCLIGEDVCDINATNDALETALDVVLKEDLPRDVLTRHLDDNFDRTNQTFSLSELSKILMQHGCTGVQLLRLALYVMDDRMLLRTIVEDMTSLTEPYVAKFAALLLQVSVFHQFHDVVLLLFEKGVPVEYFWQYPFMPGVRFNSGRAVDTWHIENGEMYNLPEMDESEIHLNEKLTMTFAWRAEWDNGDNTLAQYRADLKLDPDSAVLFLRAANKPMHLQYVTSDVRGYLPVSCGGPDMAAHVFSHVAAEVGCTNISVANNDTNNNVPSLKHLCRMSIKFGFKKNVYASLMHIDTLPTILKDYILFHY